MTNKSNLNGDCFEAVMLMPEGWVVLSPWVTTLDGHLYRVHISAPGHGEEAREWARHLAKQLNEKPRS